MGIVLHLFIVDFSSGFQHLSEQNQISYGTVFELLALLPDHQLPLSSTWIISNQVKNNLRETQ